MVYEKPPWIFKGKALYQLQLVKSEEARKYIPPDFKLVELFGYTLGGIYLARYEDSPAGAFDELVAMAGLVWNPPTSCAWAARVYVNNREARDHGISHVGLPSRLASFKLVGGKGEPAGQRSWWMQGDGVEGDGAKHPTGRQNLPQQQLQPQPPALLELSNADPVRGRGLSTPVARITLPGPDRPIGPRIALSLPSFSGATPEVPGLLRYACDLRTHVGLVAPLAVSVPPPARGEEDSAESLAGVLGGRPLVAIEFAQMEMRVEEPEALVLAPHNATPSSGPGPAQHQGGPCLPRWATARPASLTAAWAAKILAA